MIDKKEIDVILRLSGYFAICTTTGAKPGIISQSSELTIRIHNFETMFGSDTILLPPMQNRAIFSRNRLKLTAIVGIPLILLGFYLIPTSERRITKREIDDIAMNNPVILPLFRPSNRSIGTTESSIAVIETDLTVRPEVSSASNFSNAENQSAIFSSFGNFTPGNSGLTALEAAPLYVKYPIKHSRSNKKAQGLPIRKTMRKV